jgi:N-acetylglucosamine-6-phosphate deacetylase
VAAGRQTSRAVPDGYEVWDVGGGIVMPGFVDIDSHGGYGFYAREGAEAVQAISGSLVTTT